MSNLELTKNIPEVITEKKFIDIFKFINPLSAPSSILKNTFPYFGTEEKIEKVSSEIKASFLKGENIIINIQRKIKSFCSSYIKRSILENIYLNFIDVLIQILSFQTFDEKIKIMLIEKEKIINKNINNDERI